MVITVHGFYLKGLKIIDLIGLDLSEVGVKEGVFFKFFQIERTLPL